MLDFSWSHILILLIVALIVVGPKDLPRLMRIVGQWMGKARAMADEFRKSFDDMARQSELEELRKEIESLRNERPLASIEQELNRSIIPADMTSEPVMPPPPRSGELETVPRSGELETGGAFPDPVEPEPEPEPVATGGYTPPAP